MARATQAKNIAESERIQILTHLYTLSTKGKLEHGAIEAAAALFNRSVGKVALPWKARTAPLRTTSNIPGRRTAYTESVVKQKFSIASLKERSSLRSAESATGIPKSILHRKLKAKIGIRRVTTTLKPSMVADHLEKRLQYCLSNVVVNQGKYTYLYVNESHLVADYIGVCGCEFMCLRWHAVCRL